LIRRRRLCASRRPALGIARNDLAKILRSCEVAPLQFSGTVSLLDGQLAIGFALVFLGDESASAKMICSPAAQPPAAAFADFITVVGFGHPLAPPPLRAAPVDRPRLYVVNCAR
jgi:hypothetical protein